MSQADDALAALAARLTAQAAALAEARSESLALARSGDPARWRRPQLLWPLFAPAKATKG